MFIRSERLFLRPGWPEDWEELLAGIADEAVVRNLAQVPWPYTAEDARDFLRQPQDPRCPHFFVTLPTGSAPAEIIGGVGLLDDVTQHATLSRARRLLTQRYLAELRARAKTPVHALPMIFAPALGPAHVRALGEKL